MRRTVILAGLVLGLVAFGTAFASSARADSVGPIVFEPPSYHVGDINGQMGWTKTGPYDVKVAANDHYPAAETYRFGEFALRLSDAVTSESFGDQTFTPGLAEPAGESPLKTRFSATFWIGTTKATEQPGLHMSVSPDNGSGARMSYLRFEDHGRRRARLLRRRHRTPARSAPCRPSPTPTSPPSAARGRTRSASRSRSRAVPATTSSGSTSTATEATQGHVVGELLPLRPRADSAAAT